MAKARLLRRKRGTSRQPSVAARKQVGNPRAVGLRILAQRKTDRNSSSLLEQEAHDTANAVMQRAHETQMISPAPPNAAQRQVNEEEDTLQRQVTTEQEQEQAGGTESKAAEKEDEEEEATTVRTKSHDGTAAPHRNAASAIGAARQRGGQRLPPSDRRFFESSFDQDFSAVRVHRDAGAAKASQAVNARAFTVGNDVFFNQGEFATGSSEGKKLMAHELTHVVQQRDSDGTRQVLRRQETPNQGTKQSDKKTPTKVPQYVTASLKKQLAATVLAESWAGQEDKIRWVYYNLVTKEKGVKGLEKSAAYKKQSSWYKVWLYMVSDKTYADNKLPNRGDFKGMTVKEFCDTNQFMKKVASKRATKLLNSVDAMFQAPSKNPYSGWQGQGNVDDINRNGLYWKRARHYYWLQEEGKVTETLVDVIPAGSNTQFVFDGVAIQKYYQKKENKLPKTVKKYTAPKN